MLWIPAKIFAGVAGQPYAWIQVTATASPACIDLDNHAFALVDGVWEDLQVSIVPPAHAEIGPPNGYIHEAGETENYRLVYNEVAEKVELWGDSQIGPIVQEIKYDEIPCHGE